MSELIDISTIVVDYLEEHGYDGLQVPDGCACKKENLSPAGCMSDNCMPGYLSEGCEVHNFHIGPKNSDSCGYQGVV